MSFAIQENAMRKLIVLILALNLASCSMSGNNKESSVVKSDDLEFAVDTFVDHSQAQEFHVEEEAISATEPSFNDFQNDFQLANTPRDDDPIAMTLAEAPVRAVIHHMGEKTPIVDPYTDTFSEEPVIAKVAEETIPEIQHSSEIMDHYVVQKGDTLMMVAFKIYGDYGKWKNLKEWNPGKMKIKEGMLIQYKVPERAFGWKSEGNPYLIKTGDTLGTISMDVYQTSRRWKQLYEHNKPLIKDPNLIFAGFTIYYKPDRQLASEKE